MGFISVIQGAALQDRYRALVLGRDLKAPLTVSVSTPGGLAGESVRLVAAAPASLLPHLRERRVSAYRLEATSLRSTRAYRFDFTDGRGSGTYLETYTLPDSLPPSGLTFAVASCFYEGFNMGARIGGTLRQTLLGARPLLQLWAGDNLYVDVPSFGLFAGNRPNEHTVERYLKYFNGTAYMTSRALSPNYTTYDDHEFWNNYPESVVWLSRSSGDQRAGYARAGWACLDLFQASLNPAPVADGRSFQFAIPPLSFFVADVRTHRTLREGGSGTMMTQGDLQALRRWASNLGGPGILVIGQPLWMRTGGKNDYNPPDFAVEYSSIWNAVRAAPYDVLVISGDVHHCRLLEVTLADAPGRLVYEFVSSPASHIPTELTTVLPWDTQDVGSVSVPGAVPGSARLKARYFFGTNAPNSLGLLRFVPKGTGSVEVSAAFVDYGGDRWPAIAKSQGVQSLPLARQRFDRCIGSSLFTLRRRPPLTV